MTTLTEKFIPFRRKINNIITDLLLDGTYQDMMGLQDTNLCSDITILLEDELDEHFNQVELNDISLQVLGKQTRCSTKECLELKEKKIGKKNRSKKEICHDIAIFYVRIFNIISAILTAIDFDNNMCILRLRALFERTDGNIGKVSVCQPNSKLYPSSFLKVAGMPYLLKLYQMYDLPESSKTNEEKRREIEVLQLNIKKFFKERASDYSSMSENLTQTDNQLLSSNIKSKIQTIENNVKVVKKGLHNMKNVFEKKGMISNENIQRLNLNGNSQEPINLNTNTTSNRSNNTNTKPNNTSNSTNNKKTKSNNDNNNNLGELNNEEINNKTSNINEISNDSEENVINQKGGKNRKTRSKKSNNLSNKKTKKKRVYSVSQKGGDGFFQKIMGFIKRPTNKIEEEKVENLNNNTMDKRVKNLKNLNDLEKMISGTQVSSSKLLKGSNVKIGYVATNLSKKPECASG